MSVNVEHLRRLYRNMSDDALLDVDRDELVAEAQQILDEELTSRGLDGEAATEETDVVEAATYDHDPDWAEDGVEVFSVTAVPGITSESTADACAALTAAGIPCHVDHIELQQEEPSGPRPTHRWRVTVPGELSLQAMSILDRDVFNVDFEEEWRSHLEQLSDDQVKKLSPQQAFCGLFDKIERVNRIYKEEMARRGLNAG